MPVFAVTAGIALFSVMDALMKHAALATGAYNAMLWRSLFGVAVTLPVWLLSRRPWPGGELLKLFALRGLNSAAMATLFFWGLKYLPLAEGMALSFIAPLIALYLAAVLLGETIRPRAVFASLLGLAGVGVIAAGRMAAKDYSPHAAWGIAAMLASAVLYAGNIILQRRQALLTDAGQVAVFHNLFTSLFLLLPAPWLASVPAPALWGVIGGAAVLATLSLLVIAWGYAREETQVLLPLEYSAFIWAALMGWAMFAEVPSVATIAGAVLIVAGCLIATRKHIEQTAL